MYHFKELIVPKQILVPRANFPFVVTYLIESMKGDEVLRMDEDSR